MKELTQVREAVITALAEAGLTALAAYPEQRAKRYSCPVATVSVGTAEGRTMGFCNYLGEVYDEDAGTVREVYGKLLEGTITVELRAERAADCEKGCETAAEVLLGKLPSGIRQGELRWDALKWERTTGMFSRSGSLRCQAVFTAQGQEDGEAFLDFILKGVMQD